MAIIQFAQFAKGKNRPRPTEKNVAMQELVARLERVNRLCGEIDKQNAGLYEYFNYLPRRQRVKFAGKLTDPRNLLEAIGCYVQISRNEVESILEQAATIGGSRVGNHL